MGADQFIRPFSDRDRDALADICLRTGASGGDATGMYRSERFLADVFVLPYVERHPDLAWVIDDGDGNAIGYIVGADDTDAFEGWFRDEWWPTRRPLYADAVGDRETRLLGYADGRRPGAEALAAEHPAHLHIDLLPEAQGSGWGRRLIETLVAALAERGVTGVHLVASGDNAGAIAFYPRVGFTRAASAENVAAFTRTL